MKKQRKLNQQLILTLTVLLVGSIVAFGIVLPISIRYFIDHKMFEMLTMEQEKFIELGKYYNMEQDTKQRIYHLVYDERGNMIRDEKEEDDHFIHHRLMYKDFFSKLQEQVNLQSKDKDINKYVVDNETIYYVINGDFNNQTLISYVVDTSNASLFHQLFMNTLLIIVVVLTMILISFFKWNNRFINNLKDIQLKLDQIGEGKLDEPIQMNEDILEFREVMQALENMREKLHDNEQVKRKMIHNISHDLKTPIAVIKNYAEGIIDGVYPYGTVEQTAHIIYEQADRLQKRVQGILYLNRLEYIKSQNENYGLCNMADLIREVVSYMHNRESDVDIILKLEAQSFMGDVEKWRIVLENLIDNAKRYAVKEIRITLEENTLTVFNDGEPIEEERHGSIFEPFEVGKGGVSGLGLAIVKKTVNVYGYQITSKNEVEGGVTFKIDRVY